VNVVVVADLQGRRKRGDEREREREGLVNVVAVTFLLGRERLGGSVL
jgi:hypothetical protein